MRTLIAVAALALSACAGPSAMTPQQTVYGLENAYAAALQSAIAYKKLPVCGATTAPLCHTHAVVAQLVAADDHAHAALIDAEQIVRAKGSAAQIAAGINAARDAIAAFANTAKQ